MIQRVTVVFEKDYGHPSNRGCGSEHLIKEVMEHLPNLMTWVINSAFSNFKICSVKVEKDG